MHPKVPDIGEYHRARFARLVYDLVLTTGTGGTVTGGGSYDHGDGGDSGTSEKVFI